MAHIDPVIIAQIAQALINAHDCSHNPDYNSSYSLALAAIRKRYAKRGISDADFDALLQRVSILAAVSPYHDRAFVLHVLDVIIKIPKKSQRHIGTVNRNLDREWERLNRPIHITASTFRSGELPVLEVFGTI